MDNVPPFKPIKSLLAVPHDVGKGTWGQEAEEALGVHDLLSFRQTVRAVGADSGRPGHHTL